MSPWRSVPKNKLKTLPRTIWWNHAISSIDFYLGPSLSSQTAVIFILDVVNMIDRRNGINNDFKMTVVFKYSHVVSLFQKKHIFYSKFQSPRVQIQEHIRQIYLRTKQYRSRYIQITPMLYKSHLITGLLTSTVSGCMHRGMLIVLIDFKLWISMLY